MRKLLELIVKHIVKDQEYEIHETETDKEISFKVLSTRIGISRLVGKRGSTAEAIRNVVRALKDTKKRIYIEFINFEENEKRKSEKQEDKKEAKENIEEEK